MNQPASISDDPIQNAPHEVDTQSKLKTLLGILRRFIGVADIASVRFSLPSQLLEPIPNLEYWNYLDRPETFASIGDSEDELGRFLEVLRFWFTKDLKFVKGKPCKPYNSTLGEFFRCNWDIKDQLPSLPTTSRPSTAESEILNPKQTPSSVRVSYLTEQTSHHPPISAFVIDCPGKGITARGYDQISAKFTGTSIRVSPGAHNLGIFITIHSRGDEAYRLTHPAAHLGGLLRGSLAVYVQDYCYVTCPKTKLKAILHYLEDPWIGKAKHKVEGVIYHYDEEDDVERIKDVPKNAIRARIEGSWMGQLYYTLPGSNKQYLLIDLDPLFPEAKTVPPEDCMLPNESRRVWSGVTKAILAKDYSKATDEKTAIEERQREKAAARLASGEEWKPVFFQAPALTAGQPSLSKQGEEVMKRLHEGEYHIEDIDLTSPSWSAASNS